MVTLLPLNRLWFGLQMITHPRVTTVSPTVPVQIIPAARYQVIVTLIDELTGLCPLHAPHECASMNVVKLSDINAMVPSGVARGRVTLLSTDLHK